jgi:hypothetical protein
MKEEQKRNALKVFLRVYGVLSVVLFSTLLLSFIVQTPLLDAGGTLHWTVWDRVTDHVGPMLLGIYVVW